MITMELADSNVEPGFVVGLPLDAACSSFSLLRNVLLECIEDHRTARLLGEILLG